MSSKSLLLNVNHHRLAYVHATYLRRQIHTTSVMAKEERVSDYDKRFVTRFSLGKFRGTKLFRKMREEGKFPDLEIPDPEKPVGYKYGKKMVVVPEMIPELVVPDLTDCQLKPYVSYRTPLITEDPFTAQTLFDAVYKPKIVNDFKNGAILADGNPVEPSEEENLTHEEATRKARMTGTDIFSERIPKYWEFLEQKLE